MSASCPTKRARLEATQPLTTKFINARLLRRGVWVHDDLWVVDGVIVDPQARFWDASTKAQFEAGGAAAAFALSSAGAPPPDALAVVDCGGARLAPGFVDLQINGAFGVDFSSAECGAALACIAAPVYFGGG